MQKIPLQHQPGWVGAVRMGAGSELGSRGALWGGAWGIGMVLGWSWRGLGEVFFFSGSDRSGGGVPPPRLLPAPLHTLTDDHPRSLCSGVPPPVQAPPVRRYELLLGIEYKTRFLSLSFLPTLVS